MIDTDLRKTQEDLGRAIRRLEHLSARRKWTPWVLRAMDDELCEAIVALNALVLAGSSDEVSKRLGVPLQKRPLSPRSPKTKKASRSSKALR